jgi:hypothetical protein
MQYEWITGTVLLVSVIFLVLGAMVLFRGGWFMAWVRGSFGLLLIIVSILVGALALNLYSFRQLQVDVPIATVSFERLGPQRYEAKVSEVNGRETKFELHGDLWQIDARVLNWSGLWRSLGVGNGYQLDRIQGRFLSLEQERSEERTVYSLFEESPVGMDIWTFLHNNSGIVPGIEASYGSATYVPMADGGIFSVSLGGSGLRAKPLNDRAEIAIQAWDDV